MFASPESLRELPTARAVMAAAEHSETSPIAQHFLARKKFIEQQGLENPRYSDEIKLPDGSEVRVTHAVIDLTELNKELAELQPQPKQKLRIAVMNAGLFEATKLTGFGVGQGNTGNTEVKLAASGLFASEDSFIADAVIFIKPEGLNAVAYAKCQEAVGTASAIKLKEIIDNFKLAHNLPADMEVEFDLTGFSEGSSQILSTANQILEQKLGSIRRVFSIGGAGFLGSAEVDKADPIKFVIQAILRIREARKATRIDGYRDNTSFDFNAGPERVTHIKNKIKTMLQGDPDAFTGEKIKPMDDIANVLKFAWRFAKTKAKLTGAGESVPWRRLQAASSLNPDREKLAQAGVPMLVFGDTDDIYFSPVIIEEEINRMRATIPETKIQYIVSTLGHNGPHFEQTAFSIMMEELSDITDPAPNPQRSFNPLA